MKSILGGLCLCAAVCGCASPAQKEETAVAEAPAKSDVVIENILTRRSIRQYKPQAGGLQESQPEGGGRPFVQEHVPQRAHGGVHRPRHEV